jgi:small subunit ribosomal protein S20
MPNTKSAEKRTRSSVRKAARNRAVESRLKTLEKKFLSLAKDGKSTEAATAFRDVSSAYGKAVKAGAIKANTASRKRSRLQIRLNKAGAAKPEA